MNVLLIASRIGVAPADVVLEAAAAPWRARAEVDAVPVSDGDGDLCEVMAFYAGGTLGTIRANETAVPTLSDGEWVIDLSRSWGEDSTILGIALREALTRSPSRLIVNLPVRVFPDLGRAMMRELGAATTRDVAELLAGTDVVITATDEQPLLGVNGLPRWLDRHGMLSALEAQRLELELGAALPAPVRTVLMGEAIDPKSGWSGLGGGAALVLQAAGARVRWAGEITAQAIVPRLAQADLIVYVTGELGLDMPRSLVAIADRASESATPVLVVYGEGRLLRHELARFGLSSSYSYAREGQGIDALRRAMGPIAQTWAR
ncbi:hypothetical protein [Flaviflexus huanghaiensis]|uniref:hypothetical protein n=1 Tax=Flaviflexus huanghaiensis TaxID=1111473 RepID=UPI0015FE65E9|nr:hypothetical protein [Flaviflexus huanghaiensis]